MEEIVKAAKQYALQVLIAANVLMITAIIVQHAAGLGTMLVGPIAVAYAFYLATAFAFAYVWKRVATGNPEMLTTVFMATSGFRMLLALATLTVIYIVVGRERMMPFAIVFMIFYLIAVGHHSYFFARHNNKH